jgi:hypothetical protein
MGNISSSPARLTLWLDIPKDCRIRGEFAPGRSGVPDIYLYLAGEGEDTSLHFERAALERFVELAQHLLAAPQDSGSLPSPVTFESSLRDGIRER